MFIECKIGRTKILVILKDSACLCFLLEDRGSSKTRRNLVTVCLIEEYAKQNCCCFVNLGTSLKLAWKYLFRLDEQPFHIKKIFTVQMTFLLKEKGSVGFLCDFDSQS